MPDDLAGMIDEFEEELRSAETFVAKPSITLTDKQIENLFDVLLDQPTKQKSIIHFEAGSPYRSQPIVPSVRGKEPVLRRLKRRISSVLINLTVRFNPDRIK